MTQLPSVAQPATTKTKQKSAKPKAKAAKPKPTVEPDCAPDAKPIVDPDCTPAINIETKTIDVPCVTGELTGYQNRGVTLSNLTSDQRDKLKRITIALDEKSATLANGRIVNRPQDAIKWILENL